MVDDVLVDGVLIGDVMVHDNLFGNIMVDDVLVDGVLVGLKSGTKRPGSVEPVVDCHVMLWYYHW